MSPGLRTVDIAANTVASAQAAMRRARHSPAFAVRPAAGRPTAATSKRLRKAGCKRPIVAAGAPGRQRLALPVSLLSNIAARRGDRRHRFLLEHALCLEPVREVAAVRPTFLLPELVSAGPDVLLCHWPVSPSGITARRLESGGVTDKAVPYTAGGRARNPLDV